MGLLGGLLVGPHDAGGVAAVDDDGLAGHEGRTVAREEKRHLRDVVREAGAGDWLKGRKIRDSIFDERVRPADRVGRERRRVEPGQMELTRIDSGPTCMATALVRWMTAALAAE